MPRTITMAVDLPCSPTRLYRMYLDSKVHAAFTGVSAGWSRYYWTPWREYLSRKRKNG